jgi:hypothetical protein
MEKEHKHMVCSPCPCRSLCKSKWRCRTLVHCVIAVFMPQTAEVESLTKRLRHLEKKNVKSSMVHFNDTLKCNVTITRYSEVT